MRVFPLDPPLIELVLNSQAALISPAAPCPSQRRAHYGRARGELEPSSAWEQPSWRENFQKSSAWKYPGPAKRSWHIIIPLVLPCTSTHWISAVKHFQPWNCFWKPVILTPSSEWELVTSPCLFPVYWVMILAVQNSCLKLKWIMFIIFRASHWHCHMWVYSTRLFWGLEHPPNLNWKEWTVLLADLTFACIRVKLVTSVITHGLLPFIPVTPINPEKCGPDFISLLYHQGNHVLSSQTFICCKFT